MAEYEGERPPDEDDEAEVSPEIRAAVEEEMERLRAEGKLVRLEPRCKICRDPNLRKSVNTMLAQGLTRRAIEHALAPINAYREGNEVVTYWNIRNHQENHYNVNEAARAVYENILKKHEREDAEFGHAVGTRVNAFSFLETMMVKGYENLTDENTVVDFRDGAKASVLLHKLIREDQESGAARTAKMMAKMNRIISAVEQLVPPEKLPELFSMLEEEKTPQTIDGSVADDDIDAEGMIEFGPPSAPDDDEGEF